MRPLDRTIMQYRAKSDQLAIENARLHQQVQRLETVVDQLQDEVKNNVPPLDDPPDDRTDDGD
eukprot:8771575-Lingulodinium_polyedra.AAC.1